MLKTLLAMTIAIEILLIPLMIVCLSGISIALPGLGLVIGGELVFIVLLFVEVGLIFISAMIYRSLRGNSGGMP